MDDESSPATARRALHLRKVPGSFDDDEISPAKEHFDDLEPFKPAASMTSLQPENVPSLHPSTRDFSYMDEPTFAGDKVSDSFTEQAVRQHLQDVASSFAVPSSPEPPNEQGGRDDTFLDSPTRAPKAKQDNHDKTSNDLDHSTESKGASYTPGSVLLPQPGNSADNGDVGNGTSSLEGFSSPSVEATARTVSRALSGTSAGGYGDSGRNTATGTDDWDSSTRRDSQATELTNALSPSLSGTSGTLRNQTSEANLRSTSIDAGSTPGHQLRYGRRPRFLRSRDASQRSSVSSFTDSHDGVDSDVTVGQGVDYALQSGGAIPTLGATRSISNLSMSNILSRSVSMGSILSGIDDFHDPPGRLETLDEDENSLAHTQATTDEDLLRTPKAKGPLAPPTDTVIARRVLDVQVPESLAKEYKTKSGLATPRRPSEFTMGSSQRPRGLLTLKEQQHTIEKLTKENFDLKLKVMFLSDRLDKLSDESHKETVQENVQLKTNLAKLQRESKALRKRVKELERQQQEEDERPGTAKSGTSSNGQTDAFDPDAQEREEELIYLRERVEEYTTEIERLQSENLAKEADKRRMAEVVKQLQSVSESDSGENIGQRDEQDMYKDLLEQEQARSMQTSEDNRKLREENFRLRMKQDVASQQPGGALHHTTNIYNITKKPGQASPSRAGSVVSGEIDSTNGGGMSTASTLADELRKECGQLRHENAELRREVGAQTSMLTSRNKEKERLYQEIEDLKLAHRRGGGAAPSTIDSFLDRSASQLGAHERSASRLSGGTRAETAIEDPEREELENKNAELRDKINEMKLENQTLGQELDAALQAKQALEDEVDANFEDLMVMQKERDELIHDFNDLENRHQDLERQHNDLQAEAQETIDNYEDEAVKMVDGIHQLNGNLERLNAELADKTDNFDALQEEMRKVSEALIGLEDEQNNKIRRIQELEHEIVDANKELEDLEAKLRESNDTVERLTVQHESSQSEIAFLREEQEGDKIQISQLAEAVSKAEEALREEQDRVKQLQAQIVMERDRSESLATNDKKEMQKFVNELNREASAAKEESRKLRKNLISREVEATEWKERLMELENNLREALGDLNGTRSSLLKSIATLQRELENTVRELDSTKAALMEKERIVKQRDALLESHSLESRKVAEVLDKERVAHRNTKHQFETFQKTHQHVSRTVSTQDARIMELETTKAQDKKRIGQLEVTFKEQLNERNNLLLLLWTRLSSLCGTDWAHDNSLINGRALPSLEAVATMLPGFSKNLIAAVKTIETLVGGFQGRLKSVEKDLWREYHSLEDNLAARTKKLERLETIVRNGVASGAFGTTEMQNRILSLQDAYRQLKVENATLRTANEVRARASYSHSGESHSPLDPEIVFGSPSPSIPTGPRERTKERSRPKTSSRTTSRTNTMTRSMTAGELALQRDGEEEAAGGDGGGAQPTDPRWMLRLRDMEMKLKMEREGRVMDRAEASRRLTEQDAEIQRQAEINRRLDKDRRRARDEAAG